MEAELTRFRHTRPPLDDVTFVIVRGTSGLLINMSSWTSVETLAAFTYSPGHLAILKRRREWFHRVKAVMTAR